MRLSNLIPSIPANLVTCLDAIDIRTETDLLFSASTFDIFRRLPGGTISLQELTDYTDLVAELCAAPAISGLDMLLLENELQRNAMELTSGNQELDDFLLGLSGGRVIEISGDRGTGKSSLALNLVLHHLGKHAGSTAMWIDTTGDFSPENACQLLDSIEKPPSILERLQISLAFDIDAAQALLDHSIQNIDPHRRLLVIDVITPLLGPLLGPASAQGHAIMTVFMRQLQSLAENTNITILVINNTARVGPANPGRKPALGPSFALMADTTLWLTIDSENVDPPCHTIRVLRSGSIPLRPPVKFYIRKYILCST